MSKVFTARRFVFFVVCFLALVVGSIVPMQQHTVSAHSNMKISEFPITDKGGIVSSAVDKHGNLWYTFLDPGWTSYVVRVTPKGVTTKFFAGIERFSGKIILGQDGNMWFIDRNFRTVDRITPNGVITSFGVGNPGNGQLDDIINGKDGNIWVSEVGGRDLIGRLTPQGVLTTFPLPAPPVSAGIGNITAAKDGSIWFTEPNRNSIGRLDRNGTMQEFPVWSVKAISPAPDNGMWFTSTYTDRIGKITATGVVSAISVPSVEGLIPDGSDGLWFTDFTTSIGHMNSKGKFSEYSISSVSTIVSDGNDGLWFTESTASIGHLTHKGAVTEFPMPSVVDSITPVLDSHDIWFTEQSSHLLGTMTL